ncbi:MAG TPA: DUF2062 domain-containing protein [Candidatus Altiarchaeales archaeon]|nr:DUF2062 domain-containing protein [Candidatus Altiarchaeales archaeon]
MNLIKKTSHHFHEVARIKRSPRKIALGFAVGTFIALLPTPMVGYLLAFLVILLFPNLSSIAVIAALVFWNPFVLVFVYSLSYRIGDFLFDAEPVVKYNVVVLDRAYNFTRRFLVGNMILATTFSASSYFLVKRLAERHQKKNRSLQTLD